MKETASLAFARLQRTFATFTLGQKMVAVLGTAALLLAAVMVFRWASAPDYVPLYSNLSSKDASAVVDKLESDGVSYKLSGGNTVMVPRQDVYSTRISLSGAGLPSDSSGGADGYSLLDKQSISTSEFQEQTDFKRAMEGELAKTIEAIDGVDTAVVHLALPPQQVFAQDQAKPTASVLVSPRAGVQLEPQQVQAIVNLVAASIDGLEPDQVTVADSSGQVLSSSDGADGLGGTRAQEVSDYQDQLDSKVQTMLDRVLGPGNATVQVTAILDFDKTTTESTTYGSDTQKAPQSTYKSTETYSGSGAPSTASGVVGPSSQMGPSGSGSSGGYKNSTESRDNSVDKVVEHRETAPGSVESLHAAVVINSGAPVKLNTTDVEDLVKAAIGIDSKRGDTVAVSALPFDQTAAKANAAALAKAKAADDQAQLMSQIRTGALALLVALLVLPAWFRGRKKAKARTQATNYVVEQLRQDQAQRAALAAAQQPVLETSPATLALQRAEHDGLDDVSDELAALVERQPEEVAALLRGWLVERH